MALFRQVTSTPDIDLGRVLFNGQDANGKAVSTFEILGQRLSFPSTSDLADIAEFLTGNVLPTPTGADSWEVVSSSVNDAAAGTGARTVYINYLDNSWNTANTIVTLNGTTPVPIGPLGNCRAIQWMHSETVGSGGVAAGNIDLRIAGGGTVHERVTAGGNMSLTCRYTVPNGHYAIVDHWSRNPGTTNTQNTRLRATCRRDWPRTVIPGFLFQDILYDSESAPKMVGPLVFNPQTQIKVSTISSALNADVSASFGVNLYQI